MYGTFFCCQYGLEFYFRFSLIGKYFYGLVFHKENFFMRRTSCTWIKRLCEAKASCLSDFVFFDIGRNVFPSVMLYFF